MYKETTGQGENVSVYTPYDPGSHSGQHGGSPTRNLDKSGLEI